MFVLDVFPGCVFHLTNHVRSGNIASMGRTRTLNHCCQQETSLNVIRLTCGKPLYEIDYPSDYLVHGKQRVTS